jgi:hypothetical protein
MPNSKTHKYVSITAGGLTAAYQAKEQTGLDFCMEVFGGAVGGLMTGNLPDIFEPAISSYHRSFFHSLTAGGAIASQVKGIGNFTNFCREQSARCKENPTRIWMVQLNEEVRVPIELDGSIGKFLNKIEGLLWLFLAGFLIGAAAGYVSHVALDAVTGKRGSPLLARSII